MCKICRAALTTMLIISFAAIAWAQASALPASGANSEAQQGIVAVPEDVLTPLIDQPEIISTWRAGTLRMATVLTQPRRSGLERHW